MACVGIDLGTCNSVVATMEHGNVVVISNEEAKPTTPSVVFFTSDNLEDAAVGQSAVSLANNDPLRACRFIKKEMGTDFEFKIDGKSYTPEQISAKILRKLVEDASRNQFNGELVDEAVVTVPAWFEQRQRDATKRAAEAAGLKVRAILAEQIAAAIDYAQTQGERLGGKTVLVYDLGGGTFDATLITVDQEPDGSLAFRVLNKAGDHNLGGYNWDRALHDYVAEEFQKAHGKNPSDDPVSSDLLMLRCQEAKESLSGRQYDAPVDGSPPKAFKLTCWHEGISHSVEVTRAQFEQLTQAHFDRTIDMVSRLVEETFRPKNPAATPQELWRNVNLILLAGGSTKMPIVPASLERLSGMKPVINKGVDLNVGRGAAYAMFCPGIWVDKTGLDEPAPVPEGGDPNAARGTLRDSIEAHSPKRSIRMAIDTTSQAIGIAAVDPENESRDINSVVIPQGSPCGKVFEEVFGVHKDGQTGADIVIYAGDERELADERKLGHVRITGLPATTRAGEEIRVSLQLNGDGLIVGKAVHVPSGKDAKIEVKYTPLRATQPV